MRSVSIGWLLVIGFVSLGAAPAGAQVIGGFDADRGGIFSIESGDESNWPLADEIAPPR